MTRTSFDLRAEPWIPVRNLDGSMHEVSLHVALGRSHEFASLGGELPTTSVALLRLMLAILYRALPTTSGAVHSWLDLWQSERLPMHDIDDYLDVFGDRFDLLHPEKPFMQVAELTTAKGSTANLLPLIADVPNGDQFFTTRAGRGVARLDWPEAARWLVHCQAYDPSGIKSGALGDPRVKSGKGYPIGVGWAGNLGAIVVEGGTLRETLLLNLALQARGGDSLSSEDSAVWERDPLTAAEETPGGRIPRGPADLLTWPSRRVRLVQDGTQVTGVLICNGDRLTQQDQFAEPMTAWRRSPNQEKALKSSTPVYLPLTLNPDRSLWRGLTALLPLDDHSPKDGAPRLQPLVLQWLRRVQDQVSDALDSDLPLRTRAVGIVYGSNNSVVAELVDDALTIHAVLLGEQGRALRAAALEAVVQADAAATAVGRLAGNLAMAAGGDSGPIADDARELYYFSLDAAFRSWLAGLGTDTVAGTAQQQWQRVVFSRAREHEDRLLADAGPSAWTGRQVRDRNGRSYRVDAAVASLWFRTALRKALPLAHRTPAAAPPANEDAA